ncbi:MAG: hypothetical protein PHV74_14545 [Dehalococcoidia bacterium]|nr:hypothetical protein [Dehalococcoidia bacterium]
MERYKHTQVAYLIIIVMAATMVLIGIVLANAGMNWIAIGVLVVIAAALVLFSSLTVIINEDDLELRFGPGLIHERFKLHDIESSQIVRNRWYYGWGIRIAPNGWLYNVSGFQAVEIKFRTGKKSRIGTDDPQRLKEAIDLAIQGE